MGNIRNRDIVLRILLVLGISLSLWILPLVATAQVHPPTASDLSGMGSMKAGPNSASTSSTWQAMRGGNTPSPVQHAKAIWTGQEMLIWGGFDASDSGQQGGGRYDPARSSWLSLEEADDPGPNEKDASCAVWTGSELIVWNHARGSRYDPQNNIWHPMSYIDAPVNRFGYTAIWTGQELIIWGGVTARYEEPSIFWNDGLRYNPTTDTWTPILAGASAPTARAHHSAIWTGKEMIVWGGNNSDGLSQICQNRFTPQSVSSAPISISPQNSKTSLQQHQHPASSRNSACRAW